MLARVDDWYKITVHGLQSLNYPYVKSTQKNVHELESQHCSTEDKADKADDKSIAVERGGCGNVAVVWAVDATDTSLTWHGCAIQTASVNVTWGGGEVARRGCCRCTLGAVSGGCGVVTITGRLWCWCEGLGGSENEGARHCAGLPVWAESDQGGEGCQGHDRLSLITLAALATLAALSLCIKSVIGGCWRIITCLGECKERKKENSEEAGGEHGGRRQRVVCDKNRRFRLTRTMMDEEGQDAQADPLTPSLISRGDILNVLQYIAPPSSLQPIPPHLLSLPLLQRHHFLAITPDDPAAYLTWPSDHPDTVLALLECIKPDDLSDLLAADSSIHPDIHYTADRESVYAHVRITPTTILPSSHPDPEASLRLIFLWDQKSNSWRYHNSALGSFPKGSHSDLSHAMALFQSPDDFLQERTYAFSVDNLDDEDDAYWNAYNAVGDPPVSSGRPTKHTPGADTEDAYWAQYSSVQGPYLSSTLWLIYG